MRHLLGGGRLLEGGVYYRAAFILLLPSHRQCLLEGSVNKRAAFERGNTVTVFEMNLFKQILIYFVVCSFYEGSRFHCN